MRLALDAGVELRSELLADTVTGRAILEHQLEGGGLVHAATLTGEDETALFAELRQLIVGLTQADEAGKLLILEALALAASLAALDRVAERAIRLGLALDRDLRIPRVGDQIAGDGLGEERGADLAVRGLLQLVGGVLPRLLDDLHHRRVVEGIRHARLLHVDVERSLHQHLVVGVVGRNVGNLPSSQVDCHCRIPSDHLKRIGRFRVPLGAGGAPWGG